MTFLEMNGETKFDEQYNRNESPVGRFPADADMLCEEIKGGFDASIFLI